MPSRQNTSRFIFQCGHVDCQSAIEVHVHWIEDEATETSPPELEWRATFPLHCPSNHFVDQQMVYDITARLEQMTDRQLKQGDYTG